MEKNDVVNVLYAYSSVATASADSSQYMARYPGDEMVDVMGINYYCHAEESDTTALTNYTNTLAANLKMLTLTSKKHGKPIALTETGYRSIQSDRWWTETLAPAIKDIPLSYVMIWRNAYEVPRHYYCPFPGQRSMDDFVRFYNDPKTLFLHDVNALYLDIKKKTKE